MFFKTGAGGGLSRLGYFRLACDRDFVRVFEDEWGGGGVSRLLSPCFRRRFRFVFFWDECGGVGAQSGTFTVSLSEVESPVFMIILWVVLGQNRVMTAC